MKPHFRILVALACLPAVTACSYYHRPFNEQMFNLLRERASSRCHLPSPERERCDALNNYGPYQTLRDDVKGEQTRDGEAELRPRWRSPP